MNDTAKIAIVGWLLIVAILLQLCGCRTINGFGRDLQDATRQYQDGQS